MQRYKLTKILCVVFSVLMLSSCSSMWKSWSKSGSVDQGAEATGMNESGSFSDWNESSADKLKAPAKHSYFFDFDKYDVNSEDTASINAQADYLAAHPNARIRLEGNADARGSREYNIALGWRRVRAVAAILQQQGVSEKQVIMLSYGKEKPIAFGQDEDSYRLNRRVDLIYEVE